MKTGGGTATSIADLPADWRRTMNDETREKMKALEVAGEMKDDEFTARDMVDVWGLPSLASTTYQLKRFAKAGVVTSRKAYDPRIGRQVNAYKMV